MAVGVVLYYILEPLGSSTASERGTGYDISNCAKTKAIWSFRLPGQSTSIVCLASFQGANQIIMTYRLEF